MENGGDAAYFVGDDCGDIWEIAGRVQRIARELIGRRSKVPLLAERHVGGRNHDARECLGASPTTSRKVSLVFCRSTISSRDSANPQFSQAWIIHKAMPNAALSRLEHLAATETILKSTILPYNSYYKNLRWLMDSSECSVGYLLAA